MAGPAEAAAVAGEKARIGAAPEEPVQRAEALLDALQRLLLLDGAWLALRDDASGGHESLVGSGGDRRTATYLDGPVLVEEIEQLGMTRSPAPLRIADVPVPASEPRSWSECLLPAGFREGLGMCLFAPDGRHLGFLGLFTSSRAVPSDAARDLLAALGPALGQAVDPLRSAVAAVQLVESATAAVALTRTGRVLEVPGLDDHPALHPGAPVLVAAFALLEGPQASFLMPAPDEPGGYLTVTVLDVPDHAPVHLAAVVVLSPCGDLNGLTRRELEVLGMLVGGAHNTDLAQDLGVTPRTVATHVEHILVKLDADSRALAALRAQRRGLYVPPTLRFPA